MFERPNVSQNYDEVNSSLLKARLAGTQQGRRWLVTIMYATLLIGCTLGLAGRIGRWLNVWFDNQFAWAGVVIIGAVLGIMVSLVCATLLYYVTQGVTDQKAQYLDERQRWERDRAYRPAFYITTVIGLLVMCYFYCRQIWPMLPWLTISPEEFMPMIVLIALMWSLLPMAVIAWLKPK